MGTDLIPYEEEGGQDLTIIEDAVIDILPQDYDTALALASMQAEQEADVFQLYHRKDCTEHTKQRQKYDLKCFSDFLATRKVTRAAEDLYHEAEAWRGISYGLVRDFLGWMTDQGFAAGTINGRLFTVRKYCKLAGPKPTGAGILSETTLQHILTVQGRSRSQADNIDVDRKKAGTRTRREHAKKALPVDLTIEQALSLKRSVVSTSMADRLKLGLMIEHALRCSEVVGLDLENFNLAQGTVTFYRPKTRKTETHALKKFTMIAADTYIQACRAEGRTIGPLFLGYKGQRITTRAINERVHQLAKAIGIEEGGRISPHDLRHFWTYDALRNGTQIDQVMKGGGWTHPAMVLRYAAREGIANEGVKITEE